MAYSPFIDLSLVKTPVLVTANALPALSLHSHNWTFQEKYNHVDMSHIEFTALNLNELLMQRGGSQPCWLWWDIGGGKRGLLRGLWAKIEVGALIGNMREPQLSKIYSLEKYLISLSLSFSSVEKKWKYFKKKKVKNKRCEIPWRNARTSPNTGISVWWDLRDQELPSWLETWYTIQKLYL